MARLPLEILTVIVNELDDVQGLRHVRMASRVLCAVATPIAFRTLSVIATKGSAQNLGRLLDLPDIAAHVREFSYHDTGTDRKGKALNYVRSNAIQELASSFSRIHRLPHLETINLTFYPINGSSWNNPHDGSRLALQTSILAALEACFRVHVPSKLMFLSLHNLRSWDLSALESPAFQNLLKTLRHFHLSLVSDFFTDTSLYVTHWRHFWGTLCPRMILTPSQHTLTELTLHSDAYVGALSGLSLAGLQFPHLCTLSLRNIILEPLVDVEPFILQHATTLTRLELLACKLPAYSGPLLPPWVTLPPPFGHRWNSVWSRFALELTALIALHVDDPECSYVCTRDNPVFSQVFAGLNLSFSLDSPCPSRDATDLAALEHFRSVVTVRSEELRRDF